MIGFMISKKFIVVSGRSLYVKRPHLRLSLLLGLLLCEDGYAGNGCSRDRTPTSPDRVTRSVTMAPPPAGSDSPALDRHTAHSMVNSDVATDGISSDDERTGSTPSPVVSGGSTPRDIETPDAPPPSDTLVDSSAEDGTVVFSVPRITFRRIMEDIRREEAFRRQQESSKEMRVLRKRVSMNRDSDDGPGLTMLSVVPPTIRQINEFLAPPSRVTLDEVEDPRVRWVYDLLQRIRKPVDVNIQSLLRRIPEHHRDEFIEVFDQCVTRYGGMHGAAIHKLLKHIADNLEAQPALLSLLKTLQSHWEACVTESQSLPWHYRIITLLTSSFPSDPDACRDLFNAHFEALRGITADQFFDQLEALLVPSSSREE